MAKKKKKKDKKGFGGIVVPVLVTFAVLFSLGYIGKQSLQSGGVDSQLSVEEENEAGGEGTYKSGPQKAQAGNETQKTKPQGGTSENTATEKNSEDEKTQTENTDSKAAETANKASVYAEDASVKKLLQNALKPVGNTMFVFGGGWNSTDSGAGSSATTLGVSSKWKEFADKQGPSYDYKNVSDRSLGLDGSGYIGWVLYNTLKTQSGGEGFVMSAGSYDEKLSALGLGKRTPKEDVTVRRPGDIMSSQTDGFAYIVIGPCNDGSVLLVCSTPPGVRLCGTPAADGNADSEAVILAEQVMNDHFGSWYRRFPDCAKGYEYLTNYDKFSPDVSAVIKDGEGMRQMSAEQVIDILF